MTSVTVVGGGFTGLAAAYELARQGATVTLIEAEPHLGGLAGSFRFEGQPLEKFYHHWFISDGDVATLVTELGMCAEVASHATRTGTYFANSIFRLSNPIDLLRYNAVPLLDRVRLGAVAIAAPYIWDADGLEDRTATEWLCSAFGPRVYNTVWKPLLQGKFGLYADQVSAAWMWNKLKLRGGSRGKFGEERLLYFKGGFARLVGSIADVITSSGGRILLNAPVTEVIAKGNEIRGVVVDGREISANAVILTPALPIVTEITSRVAPQEWLSKIGEIRYLANLCLVLALDRSLVEAYWLNISDPNFPFVGVVEHTNIERPETYGGKSIVYLSKYMDPSIEEFAMDDESFLSYALPHIQRLFPEFRASWIKAFSVHRARFAQPIAVTGYRHIIPGFRTPVRGLWLATMAQIYPEDRGTNYAIRDGRRVARMALDELGISNNYKQH